MHQRHSDSAKLYLSTIAFTSLAAGILFLVAAAFSYGIDAKAEARVGCLAFGSGAALLIYLANAGVIKLPGWHSGRRPH